MSFIQKFKKINTELDLENDFFEKINYYTYKKEFIFKINFLLSEKTGHDFFYIWNNSNLNDKIEIILFLIENRNKFFKNKINSNFNYLFDFINEFNIQITYNKILHYIEKNGYKIIDNWKIIDNEESDILSNSNEEEKESYLDFKKAKTLKNKEAILFKEQKPLYSKLSLSSKNVIGQTINLKELKRLIEVFVRHDNEANDKPRKEYYDKLSEEEKIEKLEEIYLTLLIFKFKMRKEKTKK